MEIVRRGARHLEEQTGFVTCARCDSDLRVNRKDFVLSDPRENESFCTCPVCNTYIGSKSVHWGRR